MSNYIALARCPVCQREWNLRLFGLNKLHLLVAWSTVKPVNEVIASGSQAYLNPAADPHRAFVSQGGACLMYKDLCQHADSSFQMSTIADRRDSSLLASGSSGKSKIGHS